jgi:hypothetical protein
MKNMMKRLLLHFGIEISTTVSGLFHAATTYKNGMDELCSSDSPPIY